MEVEAGNILIAFGRQKQSEHKGDWRIYLKKRAMFKTSFLKRVAVNKKKFKSVYKLPVLLS